VSLAGRDGTESNRHTVPGEITENIAAVDRFFSSISDPDTADSPWLLL